MRIITLRGADLEAVTVPSSATVRETMGVMSRHSLRLAPVVDPVDGRFAGVAADGDLRRFLAAGGSLDAPVADAMNRAPIVTETDLGLHEVRTKMSWRGIEYLPLVQDGRLGALYVLWAGGLPQQLTAVIMAGGLGTRLRPMTDNCPKPLIPMGGRPILTHIIEHLRDEGVRRFILSVNYLGEMIVDHYGDGSELGVEIDYVHETKRMGTGGALGLIDPGLLSEPFLCLNADILNDLDVNALLDRHQRNRWDATMVVRDHSYTVPYGVVRRSEEGLFLFSEEKPTVTFQINAGIYMLSKSVLPLIPRDQFYDLPSIFEEVRRRGMAGGTHPHEGRWIDVGTIAEYQRAIGIYGTGRK